MNKNILTILSAVSLSVLLVACDKTDNSTKTEKPDNQKTAVVKTSGTCTGTFPSYWQDPKFPKMYEGQTVSNQPTKDYSGPVFRLSDDFPTIKPDESKEQPWLDKKFDALFNANTDQTTKKSLANEYIWLVLEYVQAGNINSGDVEKDWDVCNNQVRSWYNIPFQTYEVLSGREFTHGLTREAPVSFSVKASDQSADGTMWAVGFFNPTAAYTLGQIWQKDGTPKMPTTNVSFEEGAVVGKPLFTTLSANLLPNLKNMPAWKANISNPDFSSCNPPKGVKETMAQQSKRCQRSLTKWNPVTLLQFDVAIKDSRAPNTQWVFGTFVADGERKASEENPWKRMSPLGLMWGNSTPPMVELASAYPKEPRANGFEDAVIFWDTVDMLNAFGGADKFAHVGHLGCNSRLNGPADKAYSSCMSCHGTASVPDINNKVPPIAAQFGGVTSECAMQSSGQWIDASGAPAATKPPVGLTTPMIAFDQIDSIYFASVPAAAPFVTTVEVDNKAVNIYPNLPKYNPSQDSWISLDYSLQLSISLVQWNEWQEHQKAMSTNTTDAPKLYHEELPRRNW